MSPLLLVVLIVAIALIFNFTNGIHDAANQVAAVIFSRALSPIQALAIAALGDFVGAVFLGTAVAQTVGGGIVDPRLMQQDSTLGAIVILAALFGAIIWNLITWYFGIPSSSLHALIGGLIGAFMAGWGIAPIHWVKLEVIIIIMLVSPLIGFSITYLFTHVTFFATRWATPRVNKLFRKLQIFSLIAQSLAHGTNDAQKVMGVITFALIVTGFYITPSSGHITIPNWVILASAISMALGTFIGGTRIIKKLGSGFFKIQPIHGFASQIASTVTILTASTLGYPVSTTQVISSSIVGSGAATRPKMVRWNLAENMIYVWLITIPANILLAYCFFYVLRTVM